MTNLQIQIDFAEANRIAEIKDLKKRFFKIVKKCYVSNYNGKSFTENNFNQLMGLDYIYFIWEFIFGEPPLNDKMRKLSDELQTIYIDIKNQKFLK